MQRPRLITTNTCNTTPIPDIWCHGFARFLGRQLTPLEKTVISQLERHRRNRPQPVIVIDRQGHDSTPILRRYLDYRLASSPEGATAIICTPRPPSRRKRTPRIRHITYRSIESIRGSTPAFMLLLDAHKARTYSPLRSNQRNFRRACSVLFPILDPSGFLVIHLAADDPPAHPQGILAFTAACDVPPPRPPVTVITIPLIATAIGHPTDIRPSEPPRMSHPPPP